MILSALFLTACPNPEKTEAPEELEDLAAWFWSNQREAPELDIEASLVNLHPHVVDLTADGPAVGPLPVLTEDDIAWTGVERDPTQTVGVYLANTFECDLETLTEILTHPNQDELHDGVYDDYSRDYQHDRDEFLAGDSDLLLWATSYKATPTVNQYSATTSSGVRRANPVDGDLGPVILQGTFLPEPADFGGIDNHAFEQDYQLEVYYEVDGRIHHFYGLWRSMQIGAFSIEDDIMINFTLDALIQWDQQNEDLCATWPELP
jgi:hypothetical protein